MNIVKVILTNIIGVVVGVFLTISAMAFFESLQSWEHKEVYLQEPIVNKIISLGLEPEYCENAFYYYSAVSDFTLCFSTKYPQDKAIQFLNKKLNNTFQVQQLQSIGHFTSTGVPKEHSNYWNPYIVKNGIYAFNKNLHSYYLYDSDNEYLYHYAFSI